MAAKYYKKMNVAKKCTKTESMNVECLKTI